MCRGKGENTGRKFLSLEPDVSVCHLLAKWPPASWIICKLEELNALTGVNTELIPIKCWLVMGVVEVSVENRRLILKGY